MFESDFFSGQNTIELLARLKNVYFHGGMVLSDIMPWDNTDAFWARSPFDYRMLGWERKRSHLYEFMDFFQPSWIVLRKSVNVSSSLNLLNGIKQSINEFNLPRLILRA